MPALSHEIGDRYRFSAAALTAPTENLCLSRVCPSLPGFLPETGTVPVFSVEARCGGAGVYASVGDYDCARYIGRLVGCEERRDGRNLFRLADAFRRNLLCERLRAAGDRAEPC